MSDKFRSTLDHSNAGRRLLEIEEASNRFFIHVLSEKLVILARKLRMTPNMLSISGMLSGVFSGLCYYHFCQSLWNPSLVFLDYLYLCLGFIFMLCWHICDGADGQLARLTGQTSKSGKVIDGICDYACFAAVYFGIGLPFIFHGQHWVLWAGILAGLCHALQAASYELQREEYGYWAYNRGELPLAPLKTQGQNIFFRGLNSLYQILQMLSSGHTLQFQIDLQNYIDRHPQEGRKIIALRYQEVFPALIKKWSYLSGNSRTFLIFLFAVGHYPIGYFLFEIVIMTAYSFFMLSLLHKKQKYFLSLLP